MHYFYDESTNHKPLKRLLHKSSYKFFSLCTLDLCHLKQDGVAPTYTYMFHPLHARCSICICIAYVFINLCFGGKGKNMGN